MNRGIIGIPGRANRYLLIYSINITNRLTEHSTNKLDVLHEKIIRVTKEDILYVHHIEDYVAYRILYTDAEQNVLIECICGTVLVHYIEMASEYSHQHRIIPG